MSYATADNVVWHEIADCFSVEEFQNPHEMDTEFLRTLAKIRREAGVPMRIVSDARDPKGDVGAKKSAHKKRPCKAVDLRVKNSYERACVVMAAVKCGITRIGVYPGNSGDAGSVHLDASTSGDNPSPRMWTRY